MPEEYLFKELTTLKNRVEKSKMPSDLKSRIWEMLERLNRMAKLGSYSAEYEILSRYVDWATLIPWQETTQDNLDLKNAKKTLDTNHFGLDSVKERVLEYLAVRNLLTKKGLVETEHSPILCLVGLQGTGKTTMAESIATALGRKFIRISLGALGSTLELRGRSSTDPGAEPGQIIKALVRTGSFNPLILLDEMDKVSGEKGLRSDFMAVLLEILDPEQNNKFRDHYLDYPTNLSQILFVVSANNTGSFSAALMDRLEIITMPSYTDTEKERIARDFLLPKSIKQAGLDENQIKIDDILWPLIIKPLGYDSGIRSLKRLLDGMTRKIAKMVVEEKIVKVNITKENLKTYISGFY
ncbi:AAA family ATPase [Patescibacteria group bacterium]|nr:AAA family ATPase [Patescibacteria group bacterium]